MNKGLRPFLLPIDTRRMQMVEESDLMKKGLRLNDV